MRGLRPDRERRKLKSLCDMLLVTRISEWSGVGVTQTALHSYIFSDGVLIGRQEGEVLSDVADLVRPSSNSNPPKVQYGENKHSQTFQSARGVFRPKSGWSGEQLASGAPPCAKNLGRSITSRRPFHRPSELQLVEILSHRVMTLPHDTRPHGDSLSTKVTEPTVLEVSLTSGSIVDTPLSFATCLRIKFCYRTHDNWQ